MNAICILIKFVRANTSVPHANLLLKMMIRLQCMHCGLESELKLYSEKGEGSNDRFSIFFQETRHWIDSIRVNGIFLCDWLSNNLNELPCPIHMLYYMHDVKINHPAPAHSHTDIHQIGLHFIIKMCVSVFFSSPNHFRMYM